MEWIIGGFRARQQLDMERKILMLAHTFPPFGTMGGSIRLVKFLKYMDRGDGGWDPTVVTVRDDKELLFVGKYSTFSLEELPQEIRIIRTCTNEISVPAIKRTQLKKFVRYLLLALFKPINSYFFIPDSSILWSWCLRRAAKQELRNEGYAVIYATAPPFSVLVSAAWLKRDTGLPLVLDIKDDWVVDAAFRFRRLKKFRKYIEAKMERSCLTAADKIILVTPKSYEYYTDRYPEFSHKFECITNGCDTAQYCPFWENPPTKFHKFTLVHSGVMSYRRDLGTFFRALKNLLTKFPDMKHKLQFIIIGRMPRALKRNIEMYGLLEIIVHMNYMEHQEYLQMLIKSHLPVVINYEIPTGVPGKMYECWGSGNKMLLLDREDSAAAELLQEHELGYLARPDDAEKIESILLSAYNDWETNTIKGVDTKALHKFDRKYLTQELENLLSQIP